MKKSAFFFTFIILISMLFGQDQSVADSLYFELKRTNKEDTIRLIILGLIAQNENDPEKKLEVAQQLLQEASGNPNPVYKHNAMLQMGQTHRMLGNFDLAISDLFQALEIAETAGLNRGVIGAYTALADTYSILGNYSNAIKYYKKSIDQTNENDQSILAVTLLNLGDTYYMLEYYDSAFVCFSRSKEIYENSGNDQSGIAYNQGNMGLVQAELGNLNEAESNIKEAIYTLESLGDHYGSCIFLGFMSDIYQRKGLINEAEIFADSCLSIAKRFGLKTEVRDNLLRLSRIKEQKGEPSSALKYHKEYVAIKDSISSQQVLARIENMQSAYELSQKQAEVDLLKAQRKNQQAVIVTATVVVFAFAILVIVIFIYYRNKIRVNRVLKRQKVSLERLNETKDKFFSIISHDLRGHTGNVLSLANILKEDKDKLEEKEKELFVKYLSDASQNLQLLLDNLLNWAKSQMNDHTLSKKSFNMGKVVQKNVQLFKENALRKNIAIVFEEKDIPRVYADKDMMDFVIRNLLSNALKFTSKGDQIFIEISENEDHLAITVRDTGVGMSKKQIQSLLLSAKENKSTKGTDNEEGTGLGFAICKDFVDRNNGEFRIESKPNQGSSFTFTVPTTLTTESILKVS